MQNAVTLNERFRQTPRTSRCLDGCRREGGYPLAANARPAELLGRGISSAPSSGKDFAAKLNFNFWKTKKCKKWQLPKARCSYNYNSMETGICLRRSSAL